MFKISVYGKGGVGKSSFASNLSYQLSTRGMKVLHVGCDPKHDSTRLLTDGVPQKTFMDSLLDGGEEAVIKTGSGDVECIECGGAEPGIGCAGKGMISMFNYIERNTPEDTDVRVCDVLGDVVCGGFSVPMRRNQTDGIVLVVSEDFMSLYAANNILRGVRNLNGTACIIGMVLNSRSPSDRIRVEQFSKATGIPVLGTIEKSERFSDAESAGKTVSELFPESDSYRQISAIVDRIVGVIGGTERKYLPKPLNDNAMTQVAAKQVVSDFDPPSVRVKCGFDRLDRERGMVYKGDQAMPACTSHGAVELLLSIKDAAVVLHGPRNCAFLMEYAWNRRGSLMYDKLGENLPDNLYTTGMDASNTFTGDRDCLRRTVEVAIADGFGTVFVVMTCTPDTIGTDVRSALSGVEGAEVVIVEPDGYFLGSKFGGFTGAVRSLAALMDKDVAVEKGKVGIIGFEPALMFDRVNREAVCGILENFGLHFGTVLTDSITMGEIREFLSCEYFIALGFGHLSKRMAETVVPEGRKLLYLEPPRFLTGIEEWCNAIGDLADMREQGESYVMRKKAELEESLSDLKGKYAGRRCMFYQRKDVYLKPYVDVLEFMGFDPVALVSWPERFEMPPRPKAYENTLPHVKDVDFCHLRGKAEELGATFIVSGDPRMSRQNMPWVGMASRYLGIEGSIEWARKVDNCTRLCCGQKWKEGVH